jgi:hypothetical protein
VLLDTTQLTGGTYDSTTQEMVYRVLTPWWVNGSMSQGGNGTPAETFLWAQAQWVGVPMNERNAPDYREGNANDAVDVTLTESGTLTVAPRSKTTNAQSGTGTPSSASERAVGNGRRDVPSRRRRSVEALRKEAQRRLAQARRASKNKRGGRTVALPKGKTRTLVKKSDPLNGPSATLVIQWTPDAILGSKACAIDGGTVADGFYVELHLLTEGNIAVWHEWTEMQGDAGASLMKANRVRQGRKLSEGIPGDRDQKTSEYLFIDVALDENGNPIWEAQLAGRDEGDPDDPQDDAFLIIVRYYRLRDTLGKDAYSGKVILYNPSLQPVKDWDLAGLHCIEHEDTDGLKATLEGLQHAVRINVPVGLMPELEGADSMTDEELRNLQYRFVLWITDDHANEEKGHRRKPALERNAKGVVPPKIRVVGIKLLALEDAGEKHFPLYTRHLPKPIRDGLKSQLCPDDSNPEHAHLKPYYPTVTGIASPPATGHDAPQWKRHLYSDGHITWCKYPERAAVPMSQKLVVKADIDSNLSGTYSVKVKLICMEMKGYESRTAFLSFTNTGTGTAYAGPEDVSNWDDPDDFLRWESSPFPQEANRWVIKLRWQIYSRQSAGEAWRLEDITTTHVVYETLGEPLDCGAEEYKQPWYVILDRATAWAAGKTSDTAAMEAVTRRVYDMPLFDYPGVGEWGSLCSFASVDEHGIELDSDKEGANNQVGDNTLYPLLPNSSGLTVKYNINIPGLSAKAQCTDAASILIVLFRAMGVDTITLLINNPRDPGDFGTKDIDPIGAPGWTTTTWDYHHLGDLNTASPAGPLYDACLTLDAGGHTRRYVVGMDWSTYKSMLWDGSGNFYIYDRYLPGIVKPYYHGKHRQGSEPF